jgi:RNA polymerase sigma-70 factor (ECF subfamily)
MHARKRKDDALADDWDGAVPSTAAASDARIDLERAIATLSAPERAALTLCFALGLSNTEAADALDMPLGTLKSHVLRGREKLKTFLGDRT